MAQMQMTSSVRENLHSALAYMEQAAEAGADLIFFPELQFCPFFPQHAHRCTWPWLTSLDGPEITCMREACRRLKLWASPNIYLELDGRRCDTSLMIDSEGDIQGISGMVHITQAEHFYEQDCYDPFPDGFRTYETPFGRVGIVICFDRHLPDGIRSCASQGADLVIIPAANIIGEPLELFAWEIRVQAYQNTVFAAMCSRTGPEDSVTFAGQSLAAGPDGSLLCLADSTPRLLTVDIPVRAAAEERERRPWLTL